MDRKTAKATRQEGHDEVLQQRARDIINAVKHGDTDQVLRIVDAIDLNARIDALRAKELDDDVDAIFGEKLP